MKYKIISIIVVISIMFGAFYITGYKRPINRIHQHQVASTNEDCDSEFCSHLPLFNITTEEEVPLPVYYDLNGMPLKKKDGRVVFNDTTVHAKVEFINNHDGNNSLNDEAEVVTNALFRGRGNSSRLFDKKNYLIKFKDDEFIKDKKVSLDGLVPDDAWILHGPFLDKTLLRNYLCHNLTAEISGYAPNVRFCELILNGEYMGLYVLTEKIDAYKNSAFKISKTDPDLFETSYILRWDGADTVPFRQLNTFADNSGKRGLSYRHNEKFEIIYPSKTLTEAQKFQIQYELSKLEKALTSKDSANRQKGYRAYLDVESFVDYYILSEFYMNFDAGKRSTYLVKDVRGKIEIHGWDYNNAFNNYFNDLSDPQLFYLNNTWYDYMLKDEYFVKKVINRYRQLRKTYLSDEYILNYIDETLEYLGPAIERNNEKWGYSFTDDFIYSDDSLYQSLHPRKRNPSSYEEAVNDLKEMVVARGKFMDENIETLYSRCHESLNKHQGDKR